MAQQPPPPRPPEVSLAPHLGLPLPGPLPFSALLRHPLPRRAVGSLAPHLLPAVGSLVAGHLLHLRQRAVASLERRAVWAVAPSVLAVHPPWAADLAAPLVLLRLPGLELYRSS